MNETQARSSIASMFGLGGRLHGRFAPPADGEIEVLLPGAVWQAVVYPDGSATATLLRAYAVDNGNALLERFWRNEARALHRLSGRRHPSLPHLRGAGLIRELGIGFILLDDPGLPLKPNHPRIAALRADPIRALRTFLDLTEALAMLHGQGLVHRALTPRALAATEDPDTSVVLDGFQLSAFLASWLRRHEQGPDTGALRLLPETPNELVHLAPERLRSLFGAPARHSEGLAADVFGLGMLVAGWLVGPPSAAEADGVFKETRYNHDAHLRVIEDVRTRIRRAPLPTTLRRLIEQMIEPAASNRLPSAEAVLETLARLFQPALAEIERAASGAPQPPLNIYFLKETVERFYNDGLGRSDPKQPVEREYADLVESDVAGGTILWSPNGFEPWATTDPDNARRATVVILGRQYAHFCQTLHIGTPEEDQRVLVIKYPCEISKVWELRTQPRRRACPNVKAAFFKPGTRRRPIGADAPSWQPLIDSIRFVEDRESGSVVVATAEWLLGYEDAAHAVEEYAFERLDKNGEPGSRSIILRAKADAPYDPANERSSFVELFRREGLVMPMGDFFEREVEETLEREDQAEFLVRTERGDNVDVRLVFDERLDAQTVRFKPHESEVLVPDRGRVRPDDTAWRAVFARQKRAVSALKRSHELLSQLREPRGLQLGAPEAIANAAKDLDHSSPDSAKLVRRILDEEPFFVVQGPPGTGKTFIASYAVREILASDPYSRVLVASQSNAATDNILEAVTKRTASTGHGAALILRHASPETQRWVSPVAEGYLIEKLVAAQKDRVRGAIDAEERLRKLQGEWVKAVLSSSFDADLYTRIQRAANVVFATCAGSGALFGSVGDATGFDWIIVEEAGRAWLTELAIPMVQGARWLLIGDQEQLPPHGRGEVDRLLRRDIDERVTAEATGVNATAAMLPHLGHFRHLMEVKVGAGHWTEPRARIDEQRRMHPDIGDLISVAYYQQKLRTHPSARRAHGVSGPPLPQGTALVWLDTSSLGSAAHESGRHNQVEVNLINWFSKQLNGLEHEREPKIPPLMILSPYKRQLKRLKDYIKHVDVGVFHTVDAVQGREAEVVIVSLVRHNTHESIRDAIGFLDAPERVNVMFSRARRLLIIVGSLTHFERFGDTHWGDVARYMRSDRRFVVDVTRPPVSFSVKGRPR